jgi:hypothetical protein
MVMTGIITGKLIERYLRIFLNCDLLLHYRQLAVDLD